jgi:hypothetical protein
VLLPFLVAAVALAFALPVVRRGIILSDEGYLLQQSLDLLGGRVLYRDMDAFITPGMWFLVAGVFAAFEPSVIASRYLMWIAYGVLAWTVFRIVAPTAGRAAGLGAIGALLAMTIWAFPAWTFAFYSPIAVLLVLLALERLLAWQRSGRRRDLLLVGLLLGGAICVKQNYGVFGLLGAAAGWAAQRIGGGRDEAGDAARDVAAVALGGLIAGAPFVVYLLANGAWGDAWRSLVLHPFEFAGRHDIPFAPLSELWRPDVYSEHVERLTYLSYAHLRLGPIAPLQGVRGTQRLHVLAYWLPLLVFTAGLVLAFLRDPDRGRRVDVPLLSVVCVSAAVFVGVLPRADFNHLLNVYQPVVVSGAIVTQRAFARLRRRPWPVRGALAVLCAGVALLYGGSAALWYVGLLRSHVVPVEGPRGGILVDRIDGAKIQDLVRVVESETRPGDALLTIPDLTMLNFLTARGVPSAYYNLYEHHIAGDGGAAVVAGAERSDVRLAITRYDNFFSDRVGLVDYAPVLVDYLATRFERAFIGPEQDYIVYRRRDEPVAIVPFEDALADCRSSSDLAEVRGHLLFSALYHHSRPTEPIPPEGVVTTCTVQVPGSGGVLSLELGYLRPRSVQPGTQLVSEIDLSVDGGRSRLHEEAFRVVPRQGERRQQPFERVVLPLDAAAGREAKIEFRTRLVGSATPHPLDWKGFAMTYRDPRVQARAGGAHP